MTTEFLFDHGRTLLEVILGNFVQVLAYPANPTERVFVLYLATSLAMAAGVWWMLARRRADPGAGPVSLWRFLFPPSVWRTRSAWLDVRYFFFHQIVRVFLYGTFFLTVSDWAFNTTATLLGVPAAAGGEPATVSWPVELAYAFAAIAALDFVAYVLHYCQHRFSFLWEFHKVHHSATVMHPLTNYREHPVDNLLYAAGIGASTGLVAALVSAMLGFVPTGPTVLGVGLLVFVYNILGYNLRHSHIWLRWPGPLVYVFGSPAHHQVHHSYHPTHINTNFAFMFPVWDLVFGTFRMPSSNADVTFGLSERAEEEFTSCIGLYVVPFRNVARWLAPRRREGHAGLPPAPAPSAERR